MDMHRCGKCGEEKPAADFYPSALEGRGHWGLGGVGSWCKPCTRAKASAWKRANADKVRAAGRRYRASNREAVIERRRERRRSMAAQPREDRWYVDVLRADPCSYCGGVGGHIDHVEPVTYGGTSDIDNLVGACLVCNARKGSRPLLAFLLGVA